MCVMQSQGYHVETLQEEAAGRCKASGWIRQVRCTEGVKIWHHEAAGVQVYRGSIERKYSTLETECK